MDENISTPFSEIHVDIVSTYSVNLLSIKLETLSNESVECLPRPVGL